MNRDPKHLINLIASYYLKAENILVYLCTLNEYELS